MYWLHNFTWNENTKHQLNEMKWNKTNWNSKFNLLLLHIFFFFYLCYAEKWYFPYIKLFHEMELNDDMLVCKYGYMVLQRNGSGNINRHCCFRFTSLVAFPSLLVREPRAYNGRLAWGKMCTDYVQLKCSCIWLGYCKCTACDNQGGG